MGPSMSRRQHIDDILSDWQYEPERVCARMTKGSDGREIIQMRIDMGLLQIEVAGRPDGTRPGGAETYYDFLIGHAIHRGDGFVMDEEQCAEVDREFVQYYHRRICWLQLRQYERAVEDADHTLGLMDFCRDHSPDEQWTLSHEQYRPFVLFHRTQAAALQELDAGAGPEAAIEEISDGLDRLREVFIEFEAEDQFDDDELVERLVELREHVRDKYAVGRTLQERLSDAVAAEQYELAAKLRDEIVRRGGSI